MTPRLQDGSEYGMVQWKGTRLHQEDAVDVVTVSGGGFLVLVADGMGGHLAGEVASRETLASFSEAFAGYPDMAPPARLSQALKDANRHLASLQKGSQRGNMGTTLVVAYVDAGNNLYWLSVGDSHLYLWRSGERPRKLNADHSMWPLVREEWLRGDVSLDYALSQRSILRSAVMGEKIDLIDCPGETFPLQKGDFLLVASDGLDEWLEDVDTNKELALSLYPETKNPEAFVHYILEQVEMLEYPYQDNLTIVGVRI